jgi:hypothetical protein
MIYILLSINKLVSNQIITKIKGCNQNHFKQFSHF